MRCYHKILRISYKDHVTNEENPCKDPAGNRTTQRPPDQRTETQTAVVQSCIPFIRSCKNHLARHSERGKKTRQTEEEVGRQHQGMDRPGVCQVPEGSEEQGKMEETGREIICGAPMILAVKGNMRSWVMRIMTIIKWICSVPLPPWKGGSKHSTMTIDFNKDKTNVMRMCPMHDDDGENVTGAVVGCSQVENNSWKRCVSRACLNMFVGFCNLKDSVSSFMGQNGQSALRIWQMDSRASHVLHWLSTVSDDVNKAAHLLCCRPSSGWLVLFSLPSVKSLDRRGCQGHRRGDSAEVLFQSFLREAIVSDSGIGRDVHYLMLSIQHFLCWPRWCPPSKVVPISLQSANVKNIVCIVVTNLLQQACCTMCAYMGWTRQMTTSIRNKRQSQQVTKRGNRDVKEGRFSEQTSPSPQLQTWRQ